MRIFIGISTLILFLSACQSNKKTETEPQSKIHKVVVQEVLQVSAYSYLLVTEDGNEKWIATPSNKSEIGKTYYFKDGMEMSNFESKELNKTFETIYFVDKMSSDPDLKTPDASLNHQNALDLVQQATKPIIEKQNVKVKPVTGGITIAELHKNMKVYKDKNVRIKGKVTKYNPAILKKNWIHLQDGTEFEEKFDITATIDSEVNVGDIITIEGIVSLNKDFGYGYTYELLVEHTVLLK